MCCPSRVQIFLCQTQFTGRKGACVSKLKFLGAGTNPFWYWDLEHTHQRAVDPATAPASPKACGTVKLHMKQLQGFAAPLAGQPEMSTVEFVRLKAAVVQDQLHVQLHKNREGTKWKTNWRQLLIQPSPLNSLTLIPNTIGIKCGSSLNLGLVLKDRLNFELDPCKAPYFPLCQLTFQFWCASWNTSPFHIYHGLKFAAVWDVLGSSGWVGPTRATSGVLCSRTVLRTEYCWSRSFPTPCMLKRQYFGAGPLELSLIISGCIYGKFLS